MGLIDFIMMLNSAAQVSEGNNTDDGLWHDSAYFGDDDGLWHDTAYFTEDDGFWHDNTYF